MTASGADPSAAPLLGIVLAGGGSRRFGSPKVRARWGGRTLLEHGAVRLADVVDRVGVVGAGPGAPEEAERLGLELRPDARPGEGPLAGLETALEWAREEGRPGVLALAVDLPAVPVGLLRRLARRTETAWRSPGRSEAFAPRGLLVLPRIREPAPPPLCAAVSVEALPEVRRRLGAGERSFRSLVRAVPVAEVEVGHPPAADGGNGERSIDPFHNVNRPSDLAPTRPPVVCVVGKKKSGKTTVAVALVAELVRRGHRVMTAKHGHHFRLDTPDTDSWRHRHEGGAERVVLAGPEDLAVVGGWGPRGEPGLPALVDRWLYEADLVVAEGFKTAAFPKIEIYRTAAHAEPVFPAEEQASARVLAVATDRPDFPSAAPLFDVDDPALSRRLADLLEGTLVAGGSDPGGAGAVRASGGAGAADPSREQGGTGSGGGEAGAGS